MTTMMILRRCVVSAFLVFFSRIRFFCFFSQTRTLLHQSEKHFDKKERILVIWGGAFNKRRDFETTRFSFSFLLRTQGGKKKIHSRQKESFHLLQKRARALKEHRHTHAHTKPEREREKDDAFFFFSDIVVCLFCVRIICEVPQRERKREDILSSRL